jgi:hypothetical protein
MGEVTPFKGGKVPQKLANALAGNNDDLSAGVRGGYSVLSIRGSRWHIKTGDEQVTVTDQTTGDPVGSLRLVLVKASPNVSKNYYEGGYVEGSNDSPTCFSVDGVHPDPGAEKKQAASCAVCPKNVFGSRITDEGKKAKACSDARRIAVIPEGDFKNTEYGGPMLLRVPASSLSNLAQYGKKMTGRGFPYNTVITRVSFDHNVSYPKLEFNAVRPLTDEEGDEILELLSDPEFSSKVESVLAKDLEVVPVEDAIPADDSDIFEEPAPAKPKAKSKAKAKTAEAGVPAKDDKADAGAAKEDISDESDDALDDELQDILGSLENLD